MKEIWYFLCKSLFLLIPDRLFCQFTFMVTNMRLGFRYYWLNLNNPNSFNEKLNYLKLHQRNPLGTIVADKYAVREYVKAKLGEDILIPLLGVYEKASLIPFDTLPDQFVLKANHGSGWNIFCKNKSELNTVRVARILDGWLKKNAFYLSREYQYREIRPLVLCEQLLGHNIKDYKIFCNRGIPFMIQVDVDRFINHRRSFFDLEWNLQDFGIRYQVSSSEIQRPENLDEMLTIAKRLSEDFIFSRIDLYSVDGKVYFGEITLFPGGGNEPFLQTSQDFALGNMVTLF
jgi:hypothetical protein